MTGFVLVYGGPQVSGESKIAISIFLKQFYFCRKLLCREQFYISDEAGLPCRERFTLR